jgi:hypothetical protein
MINISLREEENRGPDDDPQVAIEGSFVLCG